MVVTGPHGDAGRGLVSRRVAPAVVAALAVRRLHEVAERRPELLGAFADAEVREAVPVALAHEVAVGRELVEVGEPDRGMDAEEPFDEGGVDEVAKALGKTSDADKASLKAAFSAIDQDGNGQLSKDELALAIKETMANAARAYAQSASITSETAQAA